jgi:two-component system nitrogen regulation response regulator NtrX
MSERRDAVSREEDRGRQEGEPTMDTEEPRIRLLLVDDEEEFRNSAGRALERQGFALTEAESGERAIEILADFRPDVVVLDLKMQGMDGIATLQRIRESDENLPVIILTGHGSYEDALSGIRLRVVDFMQKPVDLNKLGERIRKLVASGGEKPLREKSIADLMVPESLYFRIYQDQDVREAVAALEDARQRTVAEGNADRGRRTLLVFDRKERFVGLLSAEDIVRVLIPSFLLESPYASYFTGMFLAQAKVVGKLPIHDIIRSPISVEVDAPLMEATSLLVSRNLSHVPVTRKGQLVGILRPEDLYQEIATLSG